MTLAGRSAWVRDNDVLGIFAEFAGNLREELDYRIESFNARRLADNMQAFGRVSVPKMYGSLTTAKVLTMEFVQGVKIIRVAEISAAGWDTRELAACFLQVMIKQLIFDGYFHGDAYDLAESLLRLTTPFHDVDVPKFRQDIETVVMRYLRYPDEAGSLSAVLNGVFSVLAENGLRLGRELTMALKTLVQAEQIVHTLDPMLDISKFSLTSIQGFLADQFTTETIKSTLETQVRRSLKELARRVPDLQQATMKWITQYEKGKFEIELDTTESRASIE